MTDTDAFFFFEVLRAGGWVLAGILVISLAAWFLVALKWIELAREDRRRSRWERELRSRLEWNDTRGAVAVCRGQPGWVPRLVRAALSLERAPGVYERHVEPLLRGESALLQRHVGLVSVLASLLPLLGLLGTVTGMLQTFSGLSMTSELRPQAVADGIAQALVTTQAGLLAALPLILAHAAIASRIARSIDHATRLARRAVSRGEAPNAGTV